MALHNIQALLLHGSLSAAKKNEVLERFRDSGVDGPRVLIVSDVGLTGLNLPCANIMIIVVRLFCDLS
jgi:RecG-like helicase